MMERVLSDDSVQVYRANLLVDESAVTHYSAWLSSDESDRACQFGSEVLRRQFVVRRGMLRELLSRRLGCTPGSIRFEYTRLGKPLVSDCALQFSLAFSGDEAVFAFSIVESVGVDIEKVDICFSFESLLREHFVQEEIAAIGGLPISFHRHWTRKEACAKALGVGLTQPLSNYNVTGAPESWIHAAPNLKVRDLCMGPGVLAAVALTSEP